MEAVQRNLKKELHSVVDINTSNFKATEPGVT
jgi:hypothetical protein